MSLLQSPLHQDAAELLETLTLSSSSSSSSSHSLFVNDFQSSDSQTDFTPLNSPTRETPDCILPTEPHSGFRTTEFHLDDGSLSNRNATPRQSTPTTPKSSRFVCDIDVDDKGYESECEGLSQTASVKTRSRLVSRPRRLGSESIMASEANGLTTKINSPIRRPNRPPPIDLEGLPAYHYTRAAKRPIGLGLGLPSDYSFQMPRIHQSPQAVSITSNPSQPISHAPRLPSHEFPKPIPLRLRGDIYESSSISPRVSELPFQPMPSKLRLLPTILSDMPSPMAGLPSPLFPIQSHFSPFISSPLTLDAEQLATDSIPPTINRQWSPSVSPKTKIQRTKRHNSLSAQSTKHQVTRLRQFSFPTLNSWTNSRVTLLSPRNSDRCCDMEVPPSPVIASNSSTLENSETTKLQKNSRKYHHLSASASLAKLPSLRISSLPVPSASRSSALDHSAQSFKTPMSAADRKTSRKREHMISSSRIRSISFMVKDHLFPDSPHSLRMIERHVNTPSNPTASVPRGSHSSSDYESNMAISNAFLLIADGANGSGHSLSLARDTHLDESVPYHRYTGKYLF